VHNTILSNKRKHINSPDEMKGLTFGALIGAVSKLQYQSTLYYAYDNSARQRRTQEKGRLNKGRHAAPLSKGGQWIASLVLYPFGDNTHPISISPRRDCGPSTALVWLIKRMETCAGRNHCWDASPWTGSTKDPNLKGPIYSDPDSSNRTRCHLTLY
jgi:hypothetical protein